MEGAEMTGGATDGEGAGGSLLFGPMQGKQGKRN